MLGGTLSAIPPWCLASTEVLPEDSDELEIMETWYMTIVAPRTYFANPLQQRLSAALVWLVDSITFLGWTAWPLVDLLIRIWTGKLALVSSVLISADWGMAVSMAPGYFPVPVPALVTPGLLSQAYWLAAISLILGLATRILLGTNRMAVANANLQPSRPVRLKHLGANAQRRDTE